MPNPNELTAAEAARAIARRELTAVELAEACLNRIEALDERLLAWVYVDRETVLADARQADAAVAEGQPMGPLHGVPIGMKDIYYTAGIPTKAGSEVYKDFVPDYDATSLTLLKRAGALMLGKAVTTEFACLDPSPTFNPWNPAHTPGGSSSGSAVAVAARMCPAALGSQTVGSVLRPAAYNGVVGFKPTFGRVSRYGVVPVSWNLDTVGWLVRTVEDAALLLQVMAGPDVADPVSSREPVGDYLSAIVEPSAPRIGLLRRYFYEGADAESRRHLDAVAERLAEAGAEIEEIPLAESIEIRLRGPASHHGRGSGGVPRADVPPAGRGLPTQAAGDAGRRAERWTGSTIPAPWSAGGNSPRTWRRPPGNATCCSPRARRRPRRPTAPTPEIRHSRARGHRAASRPSPCRPAWQSPACRWASRWLHLPSRRRACCPPPPGARAVLDVSLNPPL